MIFEFEESMKLHPTAVVHPGANLAEDVEVGPYSIIGAHVTLGNGCVVGAHCVLEGHTTIGENNRIHTGAAIGGAPQDLRYQGQETFLEIGNNNNFREYVTVNIGTVEGGRTTRIGNHVHIMAYSHIAHNCEIHDGVIIANGGTLGGHVEIGEKAIVGGLVGIHQFVRVGKLSIIGGCSKLVQDAIPFATLDGHPARVYGLNLLGLKRAGIPNDIQQHLKHALQFLFRSGLSRDAALERIERECGESPEVLHLMDFVRRSERGICTRVWGREKEALWNE